MPAALTRGTSTVTSSPATTHGTNCTPTRHVRRRNSLDFLNHRSPWPSLDRLYQTQGKWSDLADVLRRRAALSRDPQERSQLLARRAQVLMDRLGAPEEAMAFSINAVTSLNSTRVRVST